MKRSTKIKIIVFFIVFFLCFVDLRPLFMPKKPPIVVTPVIDETRKSYNNGSCYDMTNDLCYFIVYLDDEERSWDEAEKTKFMEKKFLVSLDYLAASSLTPRTAMSTRLPRALLLQSATSTLLLWMQRALAYPIRRSFRLRSIPTDALPPTATLL